MDKIMDKIMDKMDKIMGVFMPILLIAAGIFSIFSIGLMTQIVFSTLIPPPDEIQACEEYGIIHTVKTRYLTQAQICFDTTNKREINEF